MLAPLWTLPFVVPVVQPGTPSVASLVPDSVTDTQVEKLLAALLQDRAMEQSSVNSVACSP